jgi:toxin ParE1/3/4
MKLRFTQPALAELDALLDHIAARSPRGAGRVSARIQAVTEMLTVYPKIGLPTNDPSIRRMTVSPFPYLIFYEIGDDEIIVHAVLHGARDPRSMPGSSGGET